MAISGVATYSVTTLDIINEAYEVLGIGERGETLQSDDTTVALRKMEMMLKAWMNQGIHIWMQTNSTLALTVGTQSYTLGSSGNKPFRIVKAYRSDNSNASQPIDIPLIPLSRDEYMELSNKLVQGKCVNYFYDRQINNGIFYTWPTSDNTTDTITYTSQGYIEDEVNLTNNPQFPNEWFEALSYNLALRIMPGYAATIADKTIELVTMMADSTLNAALGADREEASVMFQPDLRWQR